MTLIRTISLTVDAQRDEDVPRVMEVFARAAAGLLLEGIDARFHSYRYDDEEAEATD